ncbi:MAG: damage-control phosphatase ARMT1 family protein [Anaerolineae bacterium]
MQTYLDCYPCFVRQALDAARMAGADEAVTLKIVQRTLALLQDVPPDATPPEIGDRVHRLVRAIAGDGDPYRAVKDEATREALALYPRLKALIADASDSLERAVRVAIAGNIIDFGPGNSYDLETAVAEILERPLALDDLDALRDALQAADTLLYLGDNAGETVFDRALIETLELDVVYAVKGGPVLNDATLEDARAAGLEGAAELVSTGSNAPGTILARTSDEFRRRFVEAEIIIAKGQANYETLSPGDRRIFFLLKAKCPVIARDLGVEAGDLVVKQGQLQAAS